MLIISGSENHLELCLKDGDPAIPQLLLALGLPELDLNHFHIIALRRTLDNEAQIRELNSTPRPHEQLEFYE